MEDKKNDSGQSKLEGFFAGKGFYIVLFLCIAVIGVSAWTLLSSGKSAVQNVSLDDIEPSQPVVATPAPTEAAETVWEIPEDAVEVVAEPEQPEVQAESPAQQEQPEPVTEPQEADTAPASYVWPVYGQIEKPYAMTELIYDRTMADWRTHDGIDIEATLGGQVLAAADGTVSDIYADDLLGTTVVISHGGGIESVYSNLAELPTVTLGQSVAQGDTIGSVGTTALAEAGEVYHLHFAMRADGQSVDPAEYLPKF